MTNPDPTVHLVDYLRDVLMLKAAKVSWCAVGVHKAVRNIVVLLRCNLLNLLLQIGCYEGGCGACSVVLVSQDSEGAKQGSFAGACSSMSRISCWIAAFGLDFAVLRLCFYLSILFVPQCLYRHHPYWCHQLVLAASVLDGWLQVRSVS